MTNHIKYIKQVWNNFEKLDDLVTSMYRIMSPELNFVVYGESKSQNGTIDSDLEEDLDEIRITPNNTIEERDAGFFRMGWRYVYYKIQREKFVGRGGELFQ